MRDRLFWWLWEAETWVLATIARVVHWVTGGRWISKEPGESDGE